MIDTDSMDNRRLLEALRSCVENHLDLSESISFAFEAETFLNGDMASGQAYSDVAGLEEMEQFYIKDEDLLREEVNRRGLKELPPRKRRHQLQDCW